MVSRGPWGVWADTSLPMATAMGWSQGLSHRANTWAHRHKSVCPPPTQAPSSVATQLTSSTQFCWWLCLEEAEGNVLAGFSNPEFQGVQLCPRCPA